MNDLDLSSLKNSLANYTGVENSYLIVNKGTSSNPQWDLVRKVNGVVYFILFLLCRLPYTREQTNKAILANSLSKLLAQDPAVYLQRGCQILCRKLKIQPPTAARNLLLIQDLLPAIQEIDRFVSLMKQGQVDSDIPALRALIAQHAPQQVAAPNPNSSS